jgi:exodeoxyribonuclease VII small subunit
MKKKMNYTDALTELEQLTAQLESGTIPIDELAKASMQANELIKICEEKLRDVAIKIKAQEGDS